MAIEALLAVWGAVLSTGLAALKIWEIYRDRPRLSTSYGLSAEGYGGNEIILENPSKLPVMISYWELLLLRRRGLGYETINGRFPNEGYCDITVGAHSRHTLHFKDQDYFPWGRAALGGGAWYLKLHIVGKARPAWFEIYPK